MVEKRWINSNMGYIETKFFYVVRESTPWINSNMGYIETIAQWGKP